MSRYQRICAILLAGATVLFLANTAMATDRSADEVSRITSRLSQEIYSPYCPGKTLAMCPSAGAQDARMEIQQMARTGVSEAEIKAEFLERFGEEFELVEPPARDHLPLVGAIFVGLGLAVVAVSFLSRRRRVEAVGEDLDLDGGEGDGDDDDLYLDELRAEYRD